MPLRLVQVNIKARDDAALGRFWAQALGWRASGATPGATPVQPEGFVWPDPAAVSIDVIAVPDPETVHDRVHLELATTSAAHRVELVARLERLGATRVRDDVLADPEGNVFRVLAPREIHRDTGPIAAVVVGCADPRGLARFWAEATDWVPHGPARLRSTTGLGPYLEFRDPLAVANRIHLDLAPYPRDDKAAEVARLRTLGATDVDVGQGDVPWTCLADPEGNPFCVLAP